MNDVVLQNVSNLKILNDLANSWNESGIEKGDTVLLHSSISNILRKFRNENIDLSPETILDSFITSVGEKGTLILPTYNFEFAKGKTFNIRNTKSETGALTEAARSHAGSVRTGHPLFSFAVTGYNKNLFELDNFSAFGSDSPFAKLLELDGKIAVLDVAGEKCMTFYHYVEEMENAPNRFHKIFKGKYIDKDGIETDREYNVFSRKTEQGVETDVRPIEEYLWSKNLYTGFRPKEGSGLHVIKARVVYNEAAKVIKEGRSLNMLYKITAKQ